LEDVFIAEVLRFSRHEIQKEKRHARLHIVANLSCRLLMNYFKYIFLEINFISRHINPRKVYNVLKMKGSKAYL